MGINHSEKFSIQARTVTLQQSSKKEVACFLKEDICYHIPIFQRPYSWTGKEIGKFLTDLFLSYWGLDRKSESEPFFIGTMQITERRSNEKLGKYHNVIDGQQRLTTFLVLFKLLKLSYPHSEMIKNISLEWLKTEVNNGVQQIQLNELNAVEKISILHDESTNTFIKNAGLIFDIFQELMVQAEDEAEFNIDDFIQHVVTNIYFVVIETCAGLAKTIQIFNTINTTGLDLNGSDLFKIRMFEYLKDQQQQKEDGVIFEEISQLYERIEKQNKEWGREELDFKRILTAYQYVLIDRYKLPNVLFQYATDTFYERLFDSLSRINHWEHFGHLNGLKLDCSELNRVITSYIMWEGMSYPTLEDNCAFNFIGYSRYGRYSILIFLFIYKYMEDEKVEQNLFTFIRKISKLYWIYSVIFLRRVGHIDTWTYQMINQMTNSPFNKLMDFITAKINGNDQYGRSVKELIGSVLEQSVVHNYRLKTMICRMAGMLDEQYKSFFDSLTDSAATRLFGDTFDVEHIQSFNDKDEEQRKAIQLKWGDELNSIGNLVALESTINRSIKNKPYIEKRVFYKASKFTSIHLITEEYSDWDIGSSIRRKGLEKKKIIDYIFNSTF